MNNFAGMEDLLSDFLIEAGEMLSDVEGMLTELEEFPGDGKLHNEIFRGFHTIKGGAGFLNATELVTLCHITENLFDKLRNNELALSAELMDVIFAATAEVRRMFAVLQQSQQPDAAPGEIIAALQAALTGQKIPSLAGKAGPGVRELRTEDQVPQSLALSPVSTQHSEVDWKKLFGALTNADIVPPQDVRREPGINATDFHDRDFASAVFGRRATDVPGSTIGRRDGDVPTTAAVGSTLRVEADRLEQVLNLSGEIGFIKSRLAHLAADIVLGRNDVGIINELDLAVSQLDKLVVNMQNAVLKTRMQPIGRLLKKYPRLADDLARSLGKNVELVLTGEYIEMEMTMFEDLNEPLAHLVSNAVAYGVESAEDRITAGKPEKSIIELSAHQEGDHILIVIADDGAGMRPEEICDKAIEQGLITRETANTLDEAQCLELVFLPGFTGTDEIDGVVGCGVGMDVVKANIQKINGTINIRSEFGKGTVITIRLPLTLAILPVLILRLDEQLFAMPLSVVREIVSVTPDKLQQAPGRVTMVVRGEVLPVLPLAQLIGWEQSGTPEVGMLIKFGNNSFILSADSFAGHDEVAIKSMDIFRPKGVAGVAVSSGGDVVLILDIKELLGDVRLH